MIEHEHDYELQSNLDGETRQFTIAANAKAFRILIDGLYSEKVKAIVRELMTNAFDSHVAAQQVEPFVVGLPTMLRPTFYVRDFGTSMSHSTIMDVYSTIFMSTKDATNEQVGMLGLGSKSPFAYVDSFSVTAFDGEEARYYTAFIDATGVPTISHITTLPSDEKRGFEVSIPVELKDAYRFIDAYNFVKYGFDQQPVVDGPQQGVPVPHLEMGFFRVFPSMGHPTYLRQGCVIYPISGHVTNGNYTTIVDVPIGSCEVASSREALAYDEKTTKAVQYAVAKATEALEFRVDLGLAQAKNRLDAAKVMVECGSIIANARSKKFKGRNISNVLRVQPDIHEFEQFDLFVKNTKDEVAYIDMRDIKRIVIIVGTNRAAKAATARVRAFVDNRANRTSIVYRLRSDDWRDAGRMMRVFGLKKEQLISVGSLPTPIRVKDPVKREPTRSTRGVYEMFGTADGRKVGTLFSKTTPWTSHGNTYINSHWFERGEIRKVLEYFGMPPSLLSMSQTTIDRLKPDPEMEITVFLKRLVKESAIATRLARNAKLWNMVAQYATYESAIAKYLGISEPDRVALSLVKLCDEPPTLTLDELKAAYPMLFPMDEDAVTNYMVACDETRSV